MCGVRIFMRSVQGGTKAFLHWVSVRAMVGDFPPFSEGSGVSFPRIAPKPARL
jgi:hypothetical protein